MKTFRQKFSEDLNNIFESVIQLCDSVENLQKDAQFKDEVIGKLTTPADSWLDPDTLTLSKDTYTAAEIVKAFQLAKVHEGLTTNKTKTVLDTFIEKLENR